MSLTNPYRSEVLGAGAIRSLADQSESRAAISQVEAQMPQLARTSERLHLCIAELDGLMCKLESALDPVLNPDVTNTGSAGAAAPEPVRCPIGRSMDARSDEVCAITARVRSLLDRLAC